MNETTLDKMTTDLVECENNPVMIAECNSGSGVTTAVKVALVATGVVTATIGIVKGFKAWRRRKKEKQAANEAVYANEDVIDVQVDE